MTEAAPKLNPDTAPEPIRTAQRQPSETTPTTRPETPIATPRKARKAGASVKPRTPARTKSEHSKNPESRKYSTLKDLLQDLPPEDLTGVLRAYPAAVAQGFVKALPILNGEAFKATVIEPDHTTKTLDVEDEIVRLDSSWTRWLHDARRKSRLAIRQQRHDARTTLDDLMSGKEDFDQLFEIRLATLKAQGDAAS